MKNKTNKIIALVALVVVFMLGLTTVYSANSGALVSITLLNQNPDPARASDVVKLRFQVENSGGDPATNVEIKAIADYPFTPVGNEAMQIISSLSSFQEGDNSANVALTVKIDKDALKGTYPLKIQYRYNNGPWIETTFDVQVDNKEYARIESLDKSQIMPGKETQLNFTIVNLGNAPLQNLVFSWQEPNNVILPVYSDNSKYIKFLDAGQTVVVSYKVAADVNADAGLYYLNMNLDFEAVDGSQTNTVTSKAGILVGGKTDFDVAFSESTAGQTSLSVANIGNNPALSVSVKIPQQQNYRVQGSNSAIIGNLDRGDYTLVSFQISTNNQTQRNATNPQTADGTLFRRNSTQQNFAQLNRTQNSGLKVTIDYTDTTGERVSVDKYVQVQFRSSLVGGLTANNRSATTSSSFIGSTTFWLLIIAVILISGYFVIKRKKHQK